MQSIYLRGCEFRMKISCFCCGSQQTNDEGRQRQSRRRNTEVSAFQHPTVCQLQPSAPPRDALYSAQALSTELPPAFASWTATPAASQNSLPNQVPPSENDTSPVMPEASSDEEGTPPTPAPCATLQRPGQDLATPIEASTPPHNALPDIPGTSSDEEGTPQAPEAGSTFQVLDEAQVIVAEAVPYDTRATETGPSISFYVTNMHGVTLMSSGDGRFKMALDRVCSPK